MFRLIPYLTLAVFLATPTFSGARRVVAPVFVLTANPSFIGAGAATEFTWGRFFNSAFSAYLSDPSSNDVFVLAEDNFVFHFQLNPAISVFPGISLKLQLERQVPLNVPEEPPDSYSWENGLYVGPTFGIGYARNKLIIRSMFIVYYLAAGEGANPGASDGKGKEYFLEPLITSYFDISNAVGITASLSYFKGLPKHPDGPDALTFLVGPAIHF